jgi:KaiC/GvpD/RAD55 family RecA-like ATPase
MSNEVKEYSADLQKLFLEFLVSDKELLSRCQNVLEGSYFTRSLQATAEFIKEYAGKYSDCPTVEQIKAVTDTELRVIPGEAASHKEWFLTEFEQFARHKALEKAILTSADLLDKQRYGEVEKLIKDASNIGLPKSFGTDYYADPMGRLMQLKNQNGGTSTGWKTIDEKLYGGFNRGELNIFAGGSGAGKSLFLQNLALNWSQQGLNGVYFSLELSEGLCSMRMDAMLMGIATKDIYKNIDDVDLNIKMKGKKAGRLQIVQLTAGITVNDLKSWIKEFQIQHNNKIDFVVVDYLDLMTPVSVKISAENTFIKDKYVSEELRAMAVQGGFLFCTASQLNRGAVESVEFDHSHISGGLSKIQTADNVIGIFNSITMRERGRVQLQFMKTRSSSAVGTKIELEFNTTSLRITDLDEDSPEAPTTADVLHDRLRRQAQTESTSTPSASTTWERAKPREGFSLEVPQTKTEPSTGFRTMDSNSKLNNLLKKS